MHIARVVHIFYPDGIGDPFYSYELSLRQCSRGHRVTVLTWAKQGRDRREKVRDGFEIYRLGGINFRLDGKITEYPYVPRLPSILREAKPDVVHAHSHLFLTTLFAVREAKKLGIPSIVSVHGLYAKRDLFTNFAQKSYLHTMGRYIFNNATRIICETKAEAHEIMKYGAERAKIRIVPNAVDTNLFRPSKTRSEKPLFVWVGRFVPEKGLPYLIKAIEIVVRESKCQDAKFILVGDGPMLPLIKNMVSKLGLSKNIEFTGLISPKLVPKILSKAHAFIFPSVREGMPKAVLEAMACGLPVIASNISGVSEVIKDKYNGLLVPPKNPHAFADAILKIINNRKYAWKLGKHARKTVEINHRWSVILDLLESVYEEALNEHV